MKKIYFFFLTIITLCLFPLAVNAASGTVKVTGSSTAIVGNQIKVTVTLSSSTAIGSWQMDLNYDKSYLSLVSSSAEGGGTAMANSSASGVKSKSYNFTFKALKSGSTKVSVSSYLAYAFSDLSQMSLSSSSLSIKSMTQQELEATYSKDNSLKSLSVEGYELTPAFNKDTLEYKLTIPSDVTKVNILAEKNDSKASITGEGEKDVVEGNNRFEIIVTAQNGSEKKYILDIEVEDLNPISVNLGDKTYTIVKRKDILEKPMSYEETTININNVEVPAFYSEITNFYVVGLKDTEGNILYAIYNKENNSYSTYKELKANSLTLYLTDFPSDLKGYIKATQRINEMEVPVFKYKEDSRFIICYGMNIETGKYDYYSYDTEEGTFQIWNQEEIEELQNNVTTYLYMCMAFGIGLVFAFILILCLLKKKTKKKKRIKKEEEKINIEKLDKKSLEQKEKKPEKKEEHTKIESEEPKNNDDKLAQFDNFDNFDFWGDDKKKKK